MAFKITIVSSPIPINNNLNDKLLWLGGSLGLFSKRDKDKSCFRIFIELLKYARKNMPISSDELALKLGLTRGTVIHHINRMMDAGIIVVNENRYYLRVSNLKKLISEIHKDLEKSLYEIEEIASEIDDLLKI